MMDEREMDVYIGRCMKNWAAFQKPAQGGRERLLRVASIRPDLYHTPLGLPIADMLKSLFYLQPVMEIEADGSFVPFTQSRVWSFHLATAPRVAI
jgi:hypothetical protein